jgi:SAM-dependent methyltransferase
MDGSIGPLTRLDYQGSELELFEKAANWKRYWSSKVRPYIAGNVIEVGAGLGTSTEYLCERLEARWICLDPDTRFASHLANRISAGELPACCQARCGVLADLDPNDRVDTILYIDVLEHIDGDEAEMHLAATFLNPGGRIIVLAPAFNWLYSPFDKAIGHVRRYSKMDANRLTAPNLTLERTFYLDSIGIFASLMNRLILRAAGPTAKQIKLWDSAMVPISVHVDKLFGYCFGKTIIMVWRKL